MDGKRLAEIERNNAASVFPDVTKRDLCLALREAVGLLRFLHRDTLPDCRVVEFLKRMEGGE